MVDQVICNLVLGNMAAFPWRYILNYCDCLIYASFEKLPNCVPRTARWCPSFKRRATLKGAFISGVDGLLILLASGSSGTKKSNTTSPRSGLPWNHRPSSGPRRWKSMRHLQFHQDPPREIRIKLNVVGQAREECKTCVK